jgi:hypothetical protein
MEITQNLANYREPRGGHVVSGKVEALGSRYRTDIGVEKSDIRNFLAETPFGHPRRKSPTSSVIFR